MLDNKDKQIQTKNSSEQKDEIEELKKFLNKKKIQTEALKKIMAKLKNEENFNDK